METNLNMPEAPPPQMTPDDDLGRLHSHWPIASWQAGWLWLWVCFKLTQSAQKLGTRDATVPDKGAFSPSFPSLFFCFREAKLSFRGNALTFST